MGGQGHNVGDIETNLCSGVSSSSSSIEMRAMEEVSACSPSNRICKVAPEITIQAQFRDVLGFGFLGLVSDALPGFFFSGTLIKYLTPDSNSDIMQLSADIGGALGLICLATFLTKRLRPDPRVALMVLVQIGGMLGAWIIPWWVNMLFIGILTFGFQGLIGTLMPLTAFKPMGATRAYQFGYSIAPILGVLLVKLQGWTDMAVSPGLFLMGMMFPALALIAFFIIIDRSPWQGTTDTEKTSSKSDLFDQALQLTVADKKVAAWEVLPYIAQVVVVVLFYTFHSGFLVVKLSAALGSYHGEDGADVNNDVSLISHIFVFVVGLTALVPRISRMPHMALWVPVLTLVTLVIIEMLQYVAAMSPFPLWLFYAVATMVTCCNFFALLQMPLVVREDRNLTRKYQEFQLQVIWLTVNITRLVADVIVVFALDEALLAACEGRFMKKYPFAECSY
jgi:hypothetical protein